MVFGVGMFALVDAILKLLVVHYPALQVAGLRGLVALPVLAVWIIRRRAWRSLIRIRISVQLLRAVLAVGMLVLLTLGFRDLPLANAYTLYFIAPLLMSVLAGPLLGERAAAAHWYALVGGMVGVLIALRPGGEALSNWAGLYVLGAAFCYAGVAILTRLGSRTDSKESLMFWMMVMMAVLPTSLAVPDWVPLRGDDLWLLVILAVAGFLAQLGITEAFRLGQASVVAPFEYTALAWGVGIDWLIWSVLPDAYTLLGGAVILVSGIYVLNYELRRSPAAT